MIRYSRCTCLFRIAFNGPSKSNESDKIYLEEEHISKRYLNWTFYSFRNRHCAKGLNDERIILEIRDTKRSCISKFSFENIEKESHFLLPQA